MVIFHTAMREAFARVGIAPSNPRAGLVHMGKGWNASLSFKTAQALKAQGIL
jgi:hypothetical protein